jgi:hypothetical protein
MTDMTDKFNQAYPPKPEADGMAEENQEYVLNGEGIENCVMKNLYQDLFKHPSEVEFNKTYVR